MQYVSQSDCWYLHCGDAVRIKEIGALKVRMTRHLQQLPGAPAWKLLRMQHQGQARARLRAAPEKHRRKQRQQRKQHLWSSVLAAWRRTTPAWKPWILDTMRSCTICAGVLLYPMRSHTCQRRRTLTASGRPFTCQHLHTW